MNVRFKKPRRNQIFISSLLLTLAVFGTGVLLSYVLDYFRVDELTKALEEYELRKEAYFIEQSFISDFGGSSCESMENKIPILKEEIKKVSGDLSKYSKSSIFRKKDLNLVKREYHLLQLKFLNMITNLNDKCGKTYIPIILFFNSEEYLLNERQAYILGDISKEFQNSVVIASFDAFYDEEPLIEVLKSRFNVSGTPFIVIDNSIKFNRIVYTGEIRAVINDILEGMQKKNETQEEISAEIGETKTTTAETKTETEEAKESKKK